jgi:hypothetical protein
LQAALRDGDGHLLTQASDFKVVYPTPVFSYALTAITDSVEPGKVAQLTITVNNLTDSTAFSSFNFQVPKFTTYMGYKAGTASAVGPGHVAAGASKSETVDLKVLGGNQSPPDGSIITLVLVDPARGASVSYSLVVSKR